ncbi:hypothetical protein HII36_46880, partial [Nonomuraea sp. NN258]|nr:hypothetical protein [Nonomuraea antri]
MTWAPGVADGLTGGSVLDVVGEADGLPLGVGSAVALFLALAVGEAVEVGVG